MPDSLANYQELLVIGELGALYAAWVLLPLVPAVLIYWLFPDNQVAVSGPFAGLTIKASGAFAAYLIVFVGAYVGLVGQARDMIGGISKQYWTLKADIKLTHPDGSEIPWSEVLMNDISVHPVTYKFSNYEAKLKVEQEDGDFPLIVIRLPKFRDQYIPLKKMLKSSPSKLTIDYFNKTIKINDPVEIQELPTGGGNAAATVSPRAELKSTESSDTPR